MPINSKRKGKVAELDMVKDLSRVFPDAKRNWAEQNERSSGRDFSNTPGFCFQLKKGKNPRWKDALQEAQDQAAEDSSFGVDPEDIPVGVTRVDRGDHVAHLYLDDLLTLIQKSRR